MAHDIKCAGGCGTILASVELTEGQEYQGDAFYGMYCDECTRPKEEVTPE